MKHPLVFQEKMLTQAFEGKSIPDIARQTHINKDRLYRLIKGEMPLYAYELVILSKALDFKLHEPVHLHYYALDFEGRVSIRHGKASIAKSKEVTVDKIFGQSKPTPDAIK